MSPRVHYQYGSNTISSTLPLPVLAVEQRPVFTPIFLDRSLNVCPISIHWRHHWRNEEEVVLSLAQVGSRYWLRFPDLADFLLQPDLRHILVAQNAAADDNTLEHLLVDQVLPRYLAHCAQLLVHASAVTISGRHALFIGPSGWGKSTLAGLLQQCGHTVHSDDCVQVHTTNGRHVALPTYPSLRLFSDSLEALYPDEQDTSPVSSYSEKLRVPLSVPLGAQYAPSVDALYLLGNPADGFETVQICPSSPAQTCQALIGHSFRLDLSDRNGNAEHFARCAAVVNAVPAFRLDYPRDFSQSLALVEAITQHLSSLPRTS